MERENIPLIVSPFWGDIFRNYINKIPRSLYTEVPVFTPQRIARSRPMMAATASSIFSVDFSLSALMFPAKSVRTKMLSIIQRSTRWLPWAIFCSKVSFISFLAGGDIFLKPWPKGTTVYPMLSSFCTIWTAPQRSKAISRILNFSPSYSMNFSI